MNSILSFLQR